MNGADAIVKAIAQEGIDTVFGYPGGAIMPLYDALLQAPFKHILMRHEQAAALAADGYARVRGNVGVCLATSGPGATNLITGIANAFLDSVPMVAITGQVATPVLGTDAFQEVDVFGLTMPVVKHSFLTKTPADLGEALAQSFHLARSGRPGPVVVDVPKDVMLAKATSHPVFEDTSDQPLPDPAAIRKANQLLESCRRPLIYSGGGVSMGQALSAFRDLVARTGIPVVTTLKGIGNLPGDHPLFLGMLGMHGLKSANLAVQECDLLLVIGARFDDRATGKLAEFAPNAAVIHCDVDAAEIGKLRQVEASLTEPLNLTLPLLVLDPINPHWVNRCVSRVHAYRSRPQTRTRGIYAPRLLNNLSRVLSPEAIVTCDVGQHQMWVAQHMRFARPACHLSSGGLGTMGYGLPAAIGACYANPQAPVLCVTGDGSLMMNIQEFTTIVREQLPIKILLFDNQSLGMVRQWQELFFQERFSQIDLSDNPDFCTVALAFGLPAMRFERPSQEPNIIQAITQVAGPLLLHVRIDPNDKVWPLVAPGQPNHHMMEGVSK
ncbi:MAG: acetolactate synthase 2 catalytic subunit [Acidobacteria bacterium]|nr:acetolactate synthase 2 catalytic subunit [Acidobacteriota bacterium]